MKGYAVDASVAVKWLVAESLSDEASSLLDAGLTLLAPALLFAEAANALWAMHRPPVSPRRRTPGACCASSRACRAAGWWPHG